MQLKDILQDAMNRGDLTQDAFAKKAGLSQQYISKLVTGKTTNLSMDAAIKICRATDNRVTLGDLAAVLTQVEASAA